MKVVLFCGGLGMRLRDYSETLPKPMVPLGDRPILWHLMKYYAHFGHKDFILCLGYRGDLIKKYFLTYDECLTNDFVLEGNGARPTLLRTDISDWKMTFVDTGLRANVGERLKAVEKFIGDDEMFLVNYADGLSDLPLPQLISHFREQNKIACMTVVSPTQSFHAVALGPNGLVKSVDDLTQAGVTINGGFFVFRREFFNYLKPGEDLLHEPFRRIISEGQLIAYPYHGFWGCMDTYKDKQRLDELIATGEAPWQLWQPRPEAQ